ncbi:hypothetical protein TNCV_2770931, partial [Trichonephila clavipes]
ETQHGTGASWGLLNLAHRTGHQDLALTFLRQGVKRESAGRSQTGIDVGQGAKTAFKRESRPETQHGDARRQAQTGIETETQRGVKNPQKGHRAPQKSRGTPWGEQG